MRDFLEGREPATAHDWALYVDIEGFSYLYKEYRMKPMSILTSMVFSLLDSGHEAFTGLSAIQYGGDGFLFRQVISPRNRNLHIPLALGVALMRCTTSIGFTLRAQLSMGEASDVSGTYSEPMQLRIKEQESGGYLSFYTGRFKTFNNMLYNPILGTSIFNAYRLSRPRGPLYIVDHRLRDDLAAQGVDFVEHDEVLEVDWLRYSTANVEQAVSICLGKATVDPTVQLARYIDKYDGVLPQDWADSAGRLLGKDAIDL